MKDIEQEGNDIVVNVHEKGTVAIAVCFFVLAYMLHPLVNMSYHHIRAVYGERDLAKGLPVEVTPLSFPAEILRGRRNTWDVVRIAAVLTTACIVATWGIEVTLGLAGVVDGPAYRFDCPPPVTQNSSNGSTSWEVQGKLNFSSEIENDAPFKGDDSEGRAISRYRVGDPTSGDGKTYVGSIPTTWWWSAFDHGDEDDGFSFSFNFDEEVVSLNTLECKEDAIKKFGTIGINGNDEGKDWGSFMECEEPPEHDGTNGAVPTIILKRNEDNVTFLVMEEKNSNPSFLYSVWANDVTTSSDKKINVKHKFHIASTARMVEAIITGIVQGLETGRECVNLLWTYNWSKTYEDHADLPRAKPFGENPTYSFVGHVSDVEYIERGVKVRPSTSACFLWLLIVLVVGGVWALHTKSSKGTDIFDLAEVIKIMVTNASDSGIDFRNEGAVHIFVHQEAGKLVVTLEEGENTFSAGFLLSHGARLLQQLRQRAVTAYGARSTSPAQDVEIQAVDNSPASPSVSPVATPPLAHPTQPEGQYRLRITRLRPGRSFSGTERVRSLEARTVSPISSETSTPPNPTSPASHARQCQQIMEHQTKAIRQLEMGKNSSSGSSAASPSHLTCAVSEPSIPMGTAPGDVSSPSVHTLSSFLHVHDSEARSAQTATATTSQDVLDSPSPVDRPIVGSSATSRTTTDLHSHIASSRDLRQSPVPSRRNLLTELTVGPAEFPSLAESSSQASARVADREGGLQREVDRQSSRSRHVGRQTSRSRWRLWW